MKTHNLVLSLIILFSTGKISAQCSLTDLDGTVISYECPEDRLYITASIPYNGIYAPFV